MGVRQSKFAECTIALAAAASLCAAYVHAQQPPTFRSSIDVVNVTVTVTDHGGHFASGLGRDDFAVFEDGKSREIQAFADESAPVSLGILLDASGSMSGGKLGLARASISRLVTHDLQPPSEWLLGRFGYSLVVVREWTTDPDDVVQPLRETHATGDTALYDAVALAIPLVKAGQFSKKALLLVSDGGETKSLLSIGDVQHAIGESDVRVYAIGVDAHDGGRSGRVNLSSLRRLADETGGRTEVVTDRTAIAGATARIADDLKHQYWLAYASNVQRDGQEHRIRVDVRRTDLAVRARRAFVAD